MGFVEPPLSGATDGPWDREATLAEVRLGSLAAEEMLVHVVGSFADAPEDTPKDRHGTPSLPRPSRAPRDVLRGPALPGNKFTRRFQGSSAAVRGVEFTEATSL